jgi:tetratricopeptide (TPR) repeat protein
MDLALPDHCRTARSAGSTLGGVQPIADYDAFLSFTRKGHPDLARRIYRALDKVGIRVFIDERISEGDPISDEIITALAQSRTLIVVYSRQYLGRNACQEELRRVFIAAQAEGDPSQRIIVVNPEDGNDHIAPAELRDARYVAARESDADLSGLIRAVRDRINALPGPMSAIRHTSQPRWLPPQIPGTPGFVGRHHDLWRLHTTLRAADFPLTHATSSGPAAVITGMAGIGKTSLARAYAWNFGAAYPGGVYLTILTGARDFDTAVAQQAENVRLIAHSIGLPVNGADDDQIRVLIGEHIDRQPGLSLWIIDDLPSRLDPQIVHRLVIPARCVRTIFVSRDAGYGSQAGLIPLDGLTVTDGEAVLKRARAIEGSDERDAARRITKRLGGHPLALTFAAASLRNRHGLRSYADYAATLEPDHDVLSLVGQSLRTLDPVERLVLQLAGVLDYQALPAQLIGIVLSAIAGQSADTGRALGHLETLALARRDGTSWYIHPLIGDAARLAGPPPPVSSEALAVAAARGILTLAASATSGSAAYAIRLARILAEPPTLGDAAEADLLRRLIAEHYESIGDVVQAARMRRLLAAAQPGSAAELTSAALACNACGDYADAADLAGSAIKIERTFLALWALADALDGLGRYRESDTLWRELDATDVPSPTQQARRVAYEVSRARAHLARGQTREAANYLEHIGLRNPIHNADEATIHQINSAMVQLAILCLQTSREQEGRKLARSVMTFYRDRSAEKHATCLQAELAWAEAVVSLPLFELKTDKASWAEAEMTLERLYDSYRDSAGPSSVLTLTIAVQRALVLVRVGKRNKQSLNVVSEALPEIEARLSRKHPLWLRCQYILGLLNLRQNDFKKACQMLEVAWTGQKEVLGPHHPETLSTELELGCVLKFYDAERSRRLIAEVRQALPGVTGRKNFMYGRAFFASTLLPAMPTPLLKGFWELTNRMDYKDKDDW